MLFVMWYLGSLAFSISRLPTIKKKIFITESKRKTPWIGKEDNTSLQSFIDKNYFQLLSTDMQGSAIQKKLNFSIPMCLKLTPSCSNLRLFRYGKTRNSMNRYRCSKCGTFFTIATGKIFQEHKI